MRRFIDNAIVNLTAYWRKHEGFRAFGYVFGGCFVFASLIYMYIMRDAIFHAIYFLLMTLIAIAAVIALGYALWLQYRRKRNRVLREHASCRLREEVESAYDEALFEDKQRILDRIRKGIIAPISDSVLITRNGETIYFHDVVFSDSEQYDLYITSDRLVFLHDSRPKEIGIRAVNAMRQNSGALKIFCKSSTLEISSNRLEEISAILDYIIGVFHRYAFADDEDDTTNDRRNIPQGVRHTVWIRDGGKCVECDATDYLEFDHIIPVAKGGSNSKDNVQLLCRRCNQKKSDRI